MNARDRLNKRGLICHYCGSAPGVTADHIIPRVLGGPTNAWNLVPACRTCNNDKGGMWPTHECEKCRAAINRFCSTPELVQIALKTYVAKARILQKNIDMMEARIPDLKANKEIVLGLHEYIYQLTQQTTDSTI